MLFSLRQTLELVLSLVDKPNDFKTFQSFDGLAILALSWPFTKSHFLDLVLSIFEIFIINLKACFFIFLF